VRPARLTSVTGNSTSRIAGLLPRPLAVLYERAGLPAWPLPPALARLRVA
jgi:hypothetical protein